jgi:hypothetical protein
LKRSKSSKDKNYLYLLRRNLLSKHKITKSKKRGNKFIKEKKRKSKLKRKNNTRRSKLKESKFMRNIRSNRN